MSVVTVGYTEPVYEERFAEDGQWNNIVEVECPSILIVHYQKIDNTDLKF